MRDKELSSSSSSSEIDCGAIRQRAEQATPGPWNVAEGFGVTYIEGPGHLFVVDKVYEEGCESISAEADAEFIAHAREDIPALLDRLALLEAQQTAQTWQLDFTCGCSDHVVDTTFLRGCDVHRDGRPLRLRPVPPPLSPTEPQD